MQDRPNLAHEQLEGFLIVWCSEIRSRRICHPWFQGRHWWTCPWGPINKRLRSHAGLIRIQGAMAPPGHLHSGDSWVT